MKTIVLFLGILASGFSIAQEKIYIQSPAVFIDGDSIRDSVRQDCDLDKYLATQTLSGIVHVKKKLMAINAVATSDEMPSDDATVVNLSILAVHGNGGAAAFTGGKGFTVRADYKVAGQIIETKTLTLNTRGGIFGQFGGICKILEKDATSAAKKISFWIRDVYKRQSSMPTLSDSAAKPIGLISPIEYVDETNVRQAIKDECALGKITEGYVLERANHEGFPMKPLPTYDGTGTAIRVSIMDAVGTGGNLDRKFIKLHIDLLKNGSIISSEDFRRDTKRGLEVGACYTFERLLKSFANFAIKWTANQISIAENPGAREESAENKVEQDD